MYASDFQDGLPRHQFQRIIFNSALSPTCTSDVKSLHFMLYCHTVSKCSTTIYKGSQAFHMLTNSRSGNPTRGWRSNYTQHHYQKFTDSIPFKSLSRRASDNIYVNNAVAHRVLASTITFYLRDCTCFSFSLFVFRELYTGWYICTSKVRFTNLNWINIHKRNLKREWKNHQSDQRFRKLKTR